MSVMGVRFDLCLLGQGLGIRVRSISYGSLMTGYPVPTPVFCRCSSENDLMSGIMRKGSQLLFQQNQASSLSCFAS